MKNEWLRKAAAAALILALSGALAGCSTSAGTNAELYMSHMKRIFAGGTGSAAATQTSGQQAGSSAGQETASAIEAPAEFTVSGSTYSFTAVEGASQYLLVLCEPGSAEDDDTYLYSGTIAESGEQTYTGEIKDVVAHSYGDYTAKVFAMNSSYAMSEGVTAAYSVSGDIPAPQIAYSWDGEGLLKLQAANAGDYEMTAVPDQITVTLKGEGFESEGIIGADLADIEMDGLAPGTYTVKAEAVSGSEYVTNSPVMSEEMTVELGAEAVASADYTEPVQQGGGPGGDMGGWEVKPENITFEEGAASFAFNIGDMDFFHTTANLQDAADAGSLYTYNLANGDPNAPFENKMVLQIREDGTANLSVSAAGPIDTASVDGTWVSEGGMITVEW